MYSSSSTSLTKKGTNKSRVKKQNIDFTFWANYNFYVFLFIHFTIFTIFTHFTVIVGILNWHGIMFCLLPMHLEPSLRRKGPLAVIARYWRESVQFHRTCLTDLLVIWVVSKQVSNFSRVYLLITTSCMILYYCLKKLMIKMCKIHTYVHFS